MMPKQIFWVHIETDENSQVTTCNLCRLEDIEDCDTQKTIADDNYVVHFGSNSTYIDNIDVLYAGILIGRVLEEQDELDRKNNPPNIIKLDKEKDNE
jgi:hypothetical protein